MAPLKTPKQTCLADSAEYAATLDHANPAEQSVSECQKSECQNSVTGVIQISRKNPKFLQAFLGPLGGEYGFP